MHLNHLSLRELVVLDEKLKPGIHRVDARLSNSGALKHVAFAVLEDLDRASFGIDLAEVWNMKCVGRWHIRIMSRALVSRRARLSFRNA